MKCKGCGVEIQYIDPNEIGYSPKEDSEYCQRCYKLTHYGKLTYSFKEDVSVKNLFQKIDNLNALLVWVIDLFDLESAFQQDLSQYFNNKDVLVICTKRDLLPETTGSEKLGNYLLGRLNELNINVKGLVCVGSFGLDGKEEILEAIEVLRKDRDVILVGNTNAGKSTLLNNVFDIKDLTVSRYPGTTMDLVKLDYSSYNLYDTPGFNQVDSMQILADDSDMDYIIPKKKIKPIVYQLVKNQTLSIGGITKVDFYGAKDLSVSAYFSEKLKIHRSKAMDSMDLWRKHKGTLLKPTIKSSYFKNMMEIKPQKGKIDIVIIGLGWLCISGKFDKIVVSGADKAQIVVRKAMI